MIRHASCLNINKVTQSVKMHVAKPAGVLSASQVKSFHEDGFLLAKNLLSPDEKVSLLQWTREIQELPETPGVNKRESNIPYSTYL